ncbi:MAG: DUF642 domain-containing protein [Planctomycetota bacterium]|nr:DUF642 domain-containing protein [Planctomycetota bacterium]
MFSFKQGARSRIRRAVIEAAGAALVESLERRLLLAETHYLVNSELDVIAVDGVITLREAIYAANSDSPVGDAPAGNGADFIEFDPSLAGKTIVLNGNELVVAKDLTIIGLGADKLTIDANNFTRHFEVNPGATLTMSALKLYNGNAGEGDHGGSIYADGSLVLTDCVFTQNRAGKQGGAIYATSTSVSIAMTDCIVTQSTAVGAGGGMYQAAGSLTLDHCIFSLNTALDGGGVETAAVAQISDCRFDHNTATGAGGGGIVVYGPATITDSDFTFNQSPTYGGGIFSSGELALRGGSINDNSAGRGGGLHVQSSVLADIQNVRFERNQCTIDGAAMFVDWWRMVRMDNCVFKNNQAESSGGAMWAQPSLVEISNSSFDGNVARTWCGGALINGGGTMTVSDSSFKSNTAAYVGGGIHSWGRLSVLGSSFSANSADYGGAINHQDWPLMINRSDFAGNTARVNGGVVNTSGDNTIMHSTFEGNSAKNVGGAIALSADNRTTKLIDCLIEQNSATSAGGGIYSDQRRAEITATRILDNTANTGAGIYAVLGMLAMTGSLVAGNVANGLGGGICATSDAEVSIANTTISDNRAGIRGGGLYLGVVHNTASIVNATIAANRAGTDSFPNPMGGGIFISNNSSILLQNTIVAGNLKGTGTTPSDVFGTLLADSQHSLIGDSASAGGLSNGVNGNLVGVEAKLGPLQNNGGLSDTRALLPGSPAIDAGDNALALAPDGEPLWYDQRDKGFDRLIGLHVDMGAFEYKQPGGELHGRKWFDLNHDGQPDESWGASIVVNGGFEQYNPAGPYNYRILNPGSLELYGWQVIQPVAEVSNAWGNPAEGAHFVAMNISDVGAIAQTLVTEPGRRYRVQFSLAGDITTISGVKTLRVSAAGTQEEYTFDTTGHDLRNMGWETKTWEFKAQDTLTQLKFESLVPNSIAGPAIDNVVVLPYARDDVRIYIDQNANGTFDADEPLTFLRQDDPNTPDVDETGTYRFTGLPDGQYVVHELAAVNLKQIVPTSPSAYQVTINNANIITDLDFGNQVDGRISGTKFIDLNGNGVRDRNPFSASPPTILMVLDISNTTWNYAGYAVPNMNGDGYANRVIDAELFTMLALRKELEVLGWGATAKVGIIVFANDAANLDMDPVTPGVQLFTSPAADADGNNVPDVEQVLRSIRIAQAGTYAGNTDYRDPLAQAITTLSSGQVAADQTTLFFCSDGLADNPWSFADQVAQLQTMGVRRFGLTFGWNDYFDLTEPRKIDPFAAYFPSLEAISKMIDLPSALGIGNGEFLELGMPGVTIYLDANNNGVLDPGETSTVTRQGDPATPNVTETGWYSFDGLPIAEYVVREVVPEGYAQTAPHDPDYYLVDLRTGATADGRDFGNRALPGCIRGRKCIDTDRDGILEPGEPGQAGVTFYLDLDHDGQQDSFEPTAVSDAAGEFQFTGVTPGECVVREVTPPGFQQNLPAAQGGITVTIGPGQTVADLLFLNWDLRGCLKGSKWIDLDGNGNRDAGELGQAGVRVYLDINKNGVFDPSEPSTFTSADDPATLDVDETGLWTLPNVVPGSYILREVSPAKFAPSFPVGGAYNIDVAPLAVIEELVFGNAPLPSTIIGFKYNDLNRNCRRDRNRLRGDKPLLVFAVDVSDSTKNQFDGDAPGDMNGDGEADTILDGEIAALIAVNQALIDCGFAGKVQVAIVAFGDKAWQIDMDSTASEMQLGTLPSTDADGNGQSDVADALRGLRRRSDALRTDYAVALTMVQKTITDLGVPGSSANVLFVSDGEPNNPNDYGDEVATLRGMEVTLSAFGSGRTAVLYTLKTIDPEAVNFTSPSDLVAKFPFDPGTSGPGSGTSATSTDGLWLEPGVPGVQFYIDSNNNSQLDWSDLDHDSMWDDGEGERWTLSQTDDPATALDETGRFVFDGLKAGNYIIREVVPEGWTAMPLKPILSDDSLVSYLPFSGNTADQISGVVAKNYGADAVADRFTQANSSYFFDGFAFMRAMLPDLPLGSAPRALSIWVRSADGKMNGYAEHIVDWGKADTRQAFGVDVYWGGIWGGYMHGADVYSGVPIDTAWHNLVLTYDGTTARIFVDGQEKNSGTWPIDTPAGPLLLGTKPGFDAAATFDGTIDDIRIYDRPLSGSEVSSLYTWELTRAVVDPGGYLVQVTGGDRIEDVSFGDIFTPQSVVLTGTPGDDSFVVQLDPAGSTVQAWVNTDTSLTPTRLWQAGSVPSLQITGLAGNDTLTLDIPKGSQLPAAFSFDGAGGANTFRLLVTRPSDAISISDTQVSIGGHPIAYASAQIQLDGQAITLDSLSLSEHATVSVRTGGNRVVTAGQLQIGAGCKLDLTNNRLIVTSADLNAVSDLIRSARTGGTWQGLGITSSTAKADKTGKTGLGLRLDSQNRVFVKYTWNGDANLDGVVNADDYFQIDSGFISPKGGYYNGDFNYDDMVNADDYFLIDSAFIGQSGPLAASKPELVVSADVVVQQKARKAEPDGILSQLFSTEPVL